MIIDFHTHAFPDKLAKRAIGALAENLGGYIPYTDGTLSGLREYIHKSEADCAVVLNISTNPKQQHNVNNFAIESNGADTICFGSVHPDAPDVFEELERIKKAGLKGVKFHPDYQGFFVDDEKMIPIYRKISELGLITVFHAGMDTGNYEPIHCPPDKLAKVLPEFGGSPVVAAHMGGHMQWDDVERYLVCKDVYLDTAYSYGQMPKEQCRKIIKAHGADRILFGSDLPWGGTDREMRFVKSLGLTDSENEKILGLNAKKILNL